MNGINNKSWQQNNCDVNNKNWHGQKNKMTTSTAYQIKEEYEVDVTLHMDVFSDELHW